MSLFANSAINRIYVHAALLSVAENAGGVFIFVYLLKSGVSAPLVLCTITAINMCRLVLRQGVLSIVWRIGLRNAVIAGTLIQALAYLVLPFVMGPGAALAVYILLESLGATLYWTCYHAFQAASGDAEQRGGQVSVNQAVAALAGILAPALGSLALLTAGPLATFAGVALVQAAAALPLLGAKDVAIAKTATNNSATIRLAFAMFLADGWITGCGYFVWQIALFLTLGERFGAYGGALALAGLAGAAMSLAAGRLIDRGFGVALSRLAYGAIALVIVTKAATFVSPWAAVLANALAAMAGPIYAPTFMSRVYNLSKASSCPLRFHIVTEGGWDLGCSAACLLAAGVLAAGFSYGLPIAMGVVGALVGYKLLQSSYAA